MKPTTIFQDIYCNLDMQHLCIFLSSIIWTALYVITVKSFLIIALNGIASIMTPFLICDPIIAKDKNGEKRDFNVKLMSALV